MSQLNVTSIAGVDGGTATNAMSSTAKAWANLDGTGTISGLEDFNISSYTDNSTGSYEHIFSSSMSSGTYAVAGCSNYNDGTNECNQMQTQQEVSGSYDMWTFGVSSSRADHEHCQSVVIGDLA